MSLPRVATALRERADSVRAGERHDHGGLHWRFGSWTAPEEGGAHRSLVARRWVRALVDDHDLFAWDGLAPTQAGEKPAFAGAPHSDFSVSYSGSYLLVAVVTAGAVGVDLEVAPFDAFDHPALQRRMCTPTELSRARSMPPARRRRYLARVWTAKEAVVKSSGRGLRHDFRELALQADPPSNHDVPAEACLAHRTGGQEPTLSHLTWPQHWRPGSARDDHGPWIESRPA